MDIKTYIEQIQRDEQKRLKAIYEAQKAACEEGVTVIKNAVPVDLEGLKNSVHVETSPNLALVVDAPHALAVEQGTRPHMPPVKPLEAWAQRHGLPEGSGWAIAKKIAAEGSRPVWYMRKSQNKLERILVDKLGNIKI